MSEHAQLRAAQYLGGVLAASARVKAMEAANHARREQGKADAYGDSAFFLEAETMQEYSARAEALADSL